MELKTFFFTSNGDDLFINLFIQKNILSGNQSDCSDVIYNFFSENGFLQYNQVLKCGNSQLDLVFSNAINTLVSQCPDQLVPMIVTIPF